MISIIVPVYNTQRYIARCIESVIAQNYTDWELIVVNDATPDGAMDIVNRYSETDSRIRVINNQKKLGSMAARKNGYTVARGNYVVFLDSDDAIPPSALYDLMQEMNRGKADIVVGNFNYIDVNNRVSINRNLPGTFDSLEEIFSLVLNYKITHSLCGKLFKASLFRDYTYVTLKNMTNGEDAYLFYQILENTHALTVIDKSVYYYYQNPQSSTQTLFTEAKISNICEALSLFRAMSVRYPQIEREFQRRIVRSLCSTYAIQTDKKIINQCIKRYNLCEYLTASKIYDSFSLLDFIKNLIRIKIATKIMAIRPQ